MSYRPLNVTYISIIIVLSLSVLNQMTALGWFNAKCMDLGNFGIGFGFNRSNKAKWHQRSALKLTHVSYVQLQSIVYNHSCQV